MLTDKLETSNPYLSRCPLFLKIKKAVMMIEIIPKIIPNGFTPLGLTNFPELGVNGAIVLLPEIASNIPLNINMPPKVTINAGIAL